MLLALQDINKAGKVSFMVSTRPIIHRRDALPLAARNRCAEPFNGLPGVHYDDHLQGKC